MNLSTAIRFRFLNVLHFEGWLYDHIKRRTTLGQHLKVGVIFRSAICSRLVQCYQCGNVHFALGPGDLVRGFHRFDIRLANTVFEMYKQSAPTTAYPVGTIVKGSLMDRYL